MGLPSWWKVILDSVTRPKVANVIVEDATGEHLTHHGAVSGKIISSANHSCLNQIIILYTHARGPWVLYTATAYVPHRKHIPATGEMVVGTE